MLLDLSSQELLSAITFWGYPAMFLLMIMEGPIATLSAAFLSSLGYFNPLAVFSLSIIGDMLGDVLLYYLGYRGGRPFLLKAEKFLKIKSSLAERIEKQFEKRGAKIIFSVKATTGLVYITFILAGAIRMNFSKFLKYSFLGGLAWSGTLTLIGYFFGYAAETISTYISYTGVATFLLMIVLFISWNFFSEKRDRFNEKG